VMPSITSARRMKITPRVDESEESDFFFTMSVIVCK
jgi:hypothetical protein